MCRGSSGGGGDELQTFIHSKAYAQLDLSTKTTPCKNTTNTSNTAAAAAAAMVLY